jgi:signal transduction histidine kinase/DNA-binding NarL/FixJ family response regulator/HPt (histidine-containing phosphotransfer) domain-containing protein
MSIRVKVTLVIIAAIAVVMAASLGLSLLFTQQNLIKTTEADLRVIAQIADEYVSSEMDLLKADAVGAAKYLGTLPPEGLARALNEQITLYEDFIGMTVAGRNGVIAQGGASPVPAKLLGRDCVIRAFAGEKVISTTRRTQDSTLVFDVCVPMAGERVLLVTIDGMLFSSLIAPIRVWETGSIFIVDSEGSVIASVHSDKVRERFNFIHAAAYDPQLNDIGKFISKMTEGKPTSGFYAFEGQERFCFAVPVTGSRGGWTLGVSAPLAESPITQLRQGLLLSEFLFFLIGAVIAIVASKRVVRPILEKSRHNEELARLKAAAERASEAKSTFLANTSHEMRTPLNAIIGLSELQLLEQHDEATQADLAKIHSAGTTLLGTINDILDISKIESGKFDIIPTDYDVPSLINDTAMMSMTRIGNKPVSFVLAIDENLPVTLFGDELRVKQIFNNLLSNAFKYTMEGTVSWDIGFERSFERSLEHGFERSEPSAQTGPDAAEAGAGSAQPREGLVLVSRVTDTGIGIKPEDIERLFSDYNQVDTKSNRFIEGTGLGLAITRRLLDLMGGSIEVTSVYGEGSTFTVRIPQGFVSDVPIGHQTAANLREFRHFENKRDAHSALAAVQLPHVRVLVVDDNQTNLAVARGMMARYGMTIDCVDNGPAAISLIRDAGWRYDAVFMDHMMPGMDGIEAFEQIRALGTEYATGVPIIALTANAITGNAEMFISKGFAAFLSKPIDVMQLDAVIRQWVCAGKQGQAKDAGQDAECGQDGGHRQGSERQATNPQQDGSSPQDGDPQQGTGPAIQAVMHDAIQAARQHAAERWAQRPQPRELQLYEPQPASAQTAARQPHEVLAGLDALGIDTESGLERFGGCVEDYMRILRLYVGETRSLLAKLGAFELQQPPADGEAPMHNEAPAHDEAPARQPSAQPPKAPQGLHDYAITVHGIKGSSRSVGIEGLALMAERLERAARDNDAGFVQGQNAGFLRQADALMDSMERVLGASERHGDRPSRERPDASALGRLRLAAADFSIDGVEDALDELEGYDYRVEGDLVTWLREQCEGLAFSEIVVRLSDYAEAREGGDDEYQEAS